MRADKATAVKLRKKGKSYREICQILNISKGTLSKWFSQEEWSWEITQKLQKKSRLVSRGNIKHLNVARQMKLEELYVTAVTEADREFVLFQHEPLFLAGVMLYWGEGNKNFETGIVKVSNTDPGIIKTFRNFLMKFCGYSLAEIKIWLLLYPDLRPETCINYWSKEAGILKSNFVKPTVIKGRHLTRRLSYGTCTIYVNHKYLKKKVLRWIDLYRENLVKLP
jgi:hypothetical protein